MSLQLTEAVPWGRLASEYRRMFALTPRDLDRSILEWRRTEQFYGGDDGARQAGREL